MASQTQPRQDDTLAILQAAMQDERATRPSLPSRLTGGTLPGSDGGNPRASSQSASGEDEPFLEGYIGGGGFYARQPAAASPQATQKTTSVAASTFFSFQPYRSPWLGTGPDPLPAEVRARTLRFYPGFGNDRTPANMDDEFTLPANASSSQVNTLFYLQCPLSETTLGQGDLHFDRPTIKQVQGDDLQDAGIVGPPFGTNGSLPAYVIVPMCRVGVVKNVPVINVGVGLRSNYWISLSTNYGNSTGGYTNRAARTIQVTGIL